MSKKIINRPEDCVAEAMEGFLYAHGRDYAQVEGVSGLRVRTPKEKPALIVGGGSGHEPMFAYFVGENLADASAAGNIFTSPDPGTIVSTALSVERGRGVLFVYGNYSGDNMNFDIAAELLGDMGVETRTVRVCDDVASARARDNVYSIGVGLSGATIPGEDKPIFELSGDEMEYGLGIHGEPGIRRVKLMPADQMVDELVRRILEDSGITSGDTVCTLVNGLGATTLLELNVMNRRLAQILEEKGIRVHAMEVGSLITSLEMAGASVTLMKLDGELRAYYDMPCASPYYQKR